MTEQTIAAWTMWGTIGTALFTLLLAVFALLAWLSSRRTLDQMKEDSKAAEEGQNRHLDLIQRDMDARREADAARLDHLRADSAAQTRPYVYAKLEPSMGSGHAWDLVIRNTGQTSARNLTLEASHWPERDDAATVELKKLFSTPRALPPGTSIRTYWNLDPAGKDDGQTAGVTVPVTVKLTYTGLDDNTDEPFKDSFELDHTAVGMTPQGWQGIELPPGASPTDKKLREIVRSLSELRRNS